MSKYFTRFDIFEPVLDSLITSRTRLRMLLKFFLNSRCRAHLRGLAEEFGESTNAIRHELNNLRRAGYLVTTGRGNIIEYSANIDHPFYPELRSLVHKYVGIDKILDGVVNKVICDFGGVDGAFITGDYAQGKDSGIIDLVLVGDLDSRTVSGYISEAENLLNRRIRALILSRTEFEQIKASLQVETALWLWEKA